MMCFRRSLIASLYVIGLCSGGPAMAGVKEGVDAWQAGNYKKAIEEWQGPASTGDADAQFNIAQAYKLGRGVPADLRQAEDWYRKAALQGHEQAQANLGLILFQNGNRQAAIPWIQKAADRGEPRAQYVLGTSLFNGDLIAKDWVKAYALMTRAAAAGLPQAKTSLTQMDQYIPLEQRRQAAMMAADMERRTQMAQASPPPPAVVKPVPVPPAAPPAPKPARAKPAPAPTPAPAVAAARPASGGRWRVQLGAFGQPDNARSAWAGISGRLRGLQPYFVRAGAVTRLQAGPLASKADAEKACRAAKAAGQACFPVAP